MKKVEYEEYKEEVVKNQKDNQIYLKEFTSWLEEKGLSSKTIRNHVSNVDFYINEYLNYYAAIPMEDGMMEASEFFSDFFIRKCMWSTGYATKTTSASLKKFYQCMMEKGHIPKEKYEFLCRLIKEELHDWVDAVERYNNIDDEDDWFDF